MINPTHFIEGYSIFNETYNTPIITKAFLKKSLDDTKLIGYKTIAVWKIKFKENGNK
jgi:hypothetical protein